MYLLIPSVIKPLLGVRPYNRPRAEHTEALTSIAGTIISSSLHTWWYAFRRSAWALVARVLGKLVLLWYQWSAAAQTPIARKLSLAGFFAKQRRWQHEAAALLTWPQPHGSSLLNPIRSIAFSGFCSRLPKHGATSAAAVRPAQHSRDYGLCRCNRWRFCRPHYCDCKAQIQIGCGQFRRPTASR